MLQNDICKVTISVDSTYTLESADNKKYDIELNPHGFERNDIYHVLSINIDLYYNELNIALVGVFYSYGEDCALLEGEVLTILSNDAVIQLNVNDGAIIDFKTFDCYGCNFGIYKIKDGYIIYGETEIIMLDFDFNEKWSFSGVDIFVSITNKQAFELCENSIKLYDFQDNFYEIDYNGKLISEK